MGDYIGAYRVMEDNYKAGKLKAIGVFKKTTMNRLLHLRLNSRYRYRIHLGQRQTSLNG